MSPQNIFCPNIDCPARGQKNEGNIHPHSDVEKRYACDVCKRTFSATKGTIFYRLKTDAAIVMIVIVLMAHGCPIPAIVAAYGFDPRTVKSWWERAGIHCKELHEQTVETAQLDIVQAQADEIKVKTFWLGGVISPTRDKTMIEELVGTIRQVALCRPLLIAVDGLPHYLKAVQRAFRSPLPQKRGRSRLISWSNVHVGQVIKRKTDGILTIERRWVNDCFQHAGQLIGRSQQFDGVLNTAYIERLNATFRQRLSWLSRRSRMLAHQVDTLEAGMYIVGCFYNFCDPHKSLRIRLAFGSFQHRWVQRTPALAAGLTDHIWSYQELLTHPLPPPRWQPPKKRGRRSKAVQALVDRWC